MTSSRDCIWYDQRRRKPCVVSGARDQGHPWEGLGNIDADPELLDPTDGIYTLKAGSPCIDTGRDTSAPSHGAVTVDLARTVRGSDGDGLGGGATGDGSDHDIGAYEHPPAER
jgi:hypothetical protein